MTWRCFPLRAVRAAHTPLAHRPRIGWHHARPRVRHLWVCFAVVVPVVPALAWLPWGALRGGNEGEIRGTAGGAAPVSVPEPGTLALLAGALVVLVGVRR